MPSSMMRDLGFGMGADGRARRALGGADSSSDENNRDPDEGLCAVCTGAAEFVCGGCTCGFQIGQDTDSRSGDGD